MSAKRAAQKMRKFQGLRKIANEEAAMPPQVQTQHEAGEPDLEAATVPVRHYMTKHVMPTLAQALIAVSSEQPADPIAFLSTYLAANTKGTISKIRPPAWPSKDIVLELRTLVGDVRICFCSPFVLGMGLFVGLVVRCRWCHK
jgi:hypothetical protein